MPKIINHDAYRAELAQKAVALFSKYGYTGLGMRKIAEELSISKSALYHYFPSKRSLFHACTDLITRFDDTSDYLDSEAIARTTKQEKIHTMMDFIKEMESDFPSELSLLLDYLRGRSKLDIANDSTMQLANKRYNALIGKFVEKEDAKPVYCLLLGTLLARILDAQTTDFDEVERWLLTKLQ